MENLHAAESVVQDGMFLFQAHVDMPSILSMTEEDRQQTLDSRVKGDNEAHDSFMFMFELQDDYEIFLQNCLASGIRAHAGFRVSSYPDTGSPDNEEAH